MIGSGSPPYLSRGRYALSQGLSHCLGALVAPLLPWLRRSAWFRSLPGRELRSSPPSPADLIHVLGGGRRLPTLRVDHAVELYRRRMAPILYLTGAGFQVNWAESNRRRALELGVPESSVLLDPYPVSTRAEAHALRRLARRRRMRSVILVTDAFHAGRAARVFERALAGDGVRILSCPADLEGFPPARWWEDRETRSIVLGEAARLLLARATGRA